MSADNMLGRVSARLHLKSRAASNPARGFFFFSRLGLTAGDLKIEPPLLELRLIVFAALAFAAADDSTPAQGTVARRNHRPLPARAIVAIDHDPVRR